MGVFDRFKRGLEKTRRFVASSVNRIAANLGRFDEDALDELETVLIAADCGVAAATALTDAVRCDVQMTGDYSQAHVYDVLRGAMRQMIVSGNVTLESGLNIIMMIGVNGSGKTTMTGKLAKRYKDEGYKVLLAAADTFRAAAIDQLKVWGERVGVSVVAHSPGSDPAAVVFDAVQAAKARHVDVLIVDTAGRLHNKKPLMDELAKMHRVLEREAPDAHLVRLLVLDATTGQNAVKQAEAFAAIGAIDGLVLAKLDGNAKGGVALAVADTTDAPIVLAGLGEGVDDVADFDADAFVETLLPSS